MYPMSGKKIQVNLIDNCKNQHRSVGTCWGCMSQNPPQEVEAVFDGTGVIDILHNTQVFQEQIPGYTWHKVLWIREARTINSRIYDFVRDNHALLFDKGLERIYTWDPGLLSLDDRIKWTFGTGSSMKAHERVLFEKTKRASMIVRNKTMCPLHQIRKQAADALRDVVPIFGSYGSGEIESKLEALRDFRYSFVIENDTSGTITEKIIDCFVTGTVPIYIGPPLPTHLGFAEEGIICWDLQTEFNLKMLDEARYEEMYPYIVQNYKTALKYLCPPDYMFGHNGFYWND